METRKWTDKDGQEKYTTEVVLRPFRGELTMLTQQGGGGSAPRATMTAHPQALPPSAAAVAIWMTAFHFNAESETLPD